MCPRGDIFFMEIKKATTYREQVEKIEQRGCCIENVDDAVRCLESINYYRLSAYFLPFRKDDGSYNAGTSFSRIVQIYEFDRLLRRSLFSALEEIEISMRARLAYFHAHKYSPVGYLDASIYSHSHKHQKFLDTFNREVAHSSNVPFVKHHLDCYDGVFPIWVAVELFSFGMLSYFYADLVLADQKHFASEYYKTVPKNLKSWLRCATDLRNICAHYGRLYYRIFSAIPANIEEVEEKDERSLWAAFLAVRNLYPNPQKWNEEFLPSIKALFEKYSSAIQLKHISFPEDWAEKAVAKI